MQDMKNEKPGVPSHLRHMCFKFSSGTLHLGSLVLPVTLYMHSGGLLFIYKITRSSDFILMKKSIILDININFTIIAMKKNVLKFITISLLLSFFLSCTDEATYSPTVDDTIRTRSVPVYVFDWENMDWMPTPSGQTPIPSPWVGQGSIASTYGLDVVNDRKAKDGWMLLYNTFDPKASGTLVNPYFILYNKYNGIMRIYLYTTSSFVTQSTYIQDGLSVVSNDKSTILNFLGSDIVDVSTTKSYSAQIQPAPFDGSLPLASNKWYMMQYEMAYDKNIASIPYSSIQMNWSMNFYNVQTISLGGTLTGTIKTAVSTASSTASGASFDLNKAGQHIISGAVGLVGSQALSKWSKDPTTGENSIGMPNDVFKLISAGVSSAISGSAAGLAGVAASFFSSIFLGGSSPQLVNLNINADIKLEGTATGGGSFPSSPTSFWMPGTNIPSSAVGYIPTYNKTMGVLNFTEQPKIEITGAEFMYMIIGSSILFDRDYYFPTNDYSKYVIFNPEVQKIANIKIRKQELLLISKTLEKKDIKQIKYEKLEHWSTENKDCYVNPSYISYGRDIYSSANEEHFDLGVRFTIDVIPHDGGTPSTITKTLLLKKDFSKVKYSEQIDF